jgi:hypothetical protein
VWQTKWLHFGWILLLLLGVFGIVLCNVNAGKFWSLEYRLWNCTVQHAFVFLDSGVVICNFYILFNMDGVRTWSGFVGGCKHTTFANGQSLLKPMFNSLNNTCNCNVFFAKSPWLIHMARLCYVHFVWSPKAHSWFNMIANHSTQTITN